MAGPNLQDLTAVMINDEGKYEQYVRLVAIHAGRLVNQERHGIKPNKHYDSGYLNAIIDLANGYSPEERDEMVHADIKRMRKAINADRDLRQAETL